MWRCLMAAGGIVLFGEDSDAEFFCCGSRSRVVTMFTEQHKQHQLVTQRQQFLKDTL